MQKKCTLMSGWSEVRVKWEIQEWGWSAVSVFLGLSTPIFLECVLFLCFNKSSAYLAKKKKKMGLESEMWWEMVKLRSGVRLLHYLFTFYKWLAWYLGTQNIHVIKMVETKCSTSKRGLQEEEVKQWVLTTACLGQKQKEASGQVMEGKLLSVLVVRMGQDSKHHFCKWMGL